MIKQKKLSLCAVTNHFSFNLIAMLLFSIVSLSQQAIGDLTLTNNNYQVERFAEYQQQAFGGPVRYMTVDDSGNVYTGHAASSSSIVVANGSNVSTLSNDFQNVQGLEWTGGTTYGNYIYAADTYASSIKRVDPTGNVSTFRALPEQPLVIGLDNTGNYGNKLYAGTRNSSIIYSIGELGELSEFLNISPYIGDGTLLDIKFDTSGNYNGYMYLSSYNSTNVDYRGILAVDPQGNITLFKNTSGVILEFDTSAEAVFGGDLYYCNRTSIKRIAPNGETVTLLTSDQYIWDFDFSSDGGLYVTEVDSTDIVTISKITTIPEPASILLFGVGILTTAFRRSK